VKNVAFARPRFQQRQDAVDIGLDAAFAMRGQLSRSM
jgi:hypothetical protein